MKSCTWAPSSIVCKEKKLLEKWWLLYPYPERVAHLSQAKHPEECVLQESTSWHSLGPTVKVRVGECS